MHRKKVPMKAINPKDRLRIMREIADCLVEA